jgi:hypothetical protein
VRERAVRVCPPDHEHRAPWRRSSAPAGPDPREPKLIRGADELLTEPPTIEKWTSSRASSANSKTPTRQTAAMKSRSRVRPWTFARRARTISRKVCGRVVRAGVTTRGGKRRQHLFDDERNPFSPIGKRAQEVPGNGRDLKRGADQLLHVGLSQPREAKEARCATGADRLGEVESRTRFVSQGAEGCDAIRGRDGRTGSRQARASLHPPTADLRG